MSRKRKRPAPVLTEEQKELQRRKEFRDHHHLFPVSRRMRDREQYLLYLWRKKHDAWHRLFGDKTLPEIIALLRKIARLKGIEEEQKPKKPDWKFKALTEVSDDVHR